MSRARTLVDITEMLPLADGSFEHVIVQGLRSAYASGADPLVGILYGAPASRDSIGRAPRRFLNTGLGPRASGPRPGCHRGVQSALLSWNHSKIVSGDGRWSIVGGINFWSGDYLQTRNPVTGVSMEVHGPASLAASRSATPWRDTPVITRDSGKRPTWPPNYVTACPANESGTVSIAQAEHPGDTGILAFGRLGHGIASDRQRPGASTGVSPTNAKHAACGPLSDDTNTSAAYDAVYPGEVGLRAFVASAQHSIFISQQDLVGLCLPQAHYDVRLFQILAEKIVSGAR